MRCFSLTPPHLNIIMNSFRCTSKFSFLLFIEMLNAPQLAQTELLKDFLETSKTTETNKRDLGILIVIMK